jgi:hypothetical protein
MLQELAPTATRVELSTAPEENERIKRQTEIHVALYDGASHEEITKRIEELDREWDVERILQLNSSLFSLAGIFFGRKSSRVWYALPTAIYGFLMRHAISGWCPPLPVLRKMGIRTRREIDREKYALKLMRGDFEALPEQHHALNERVHAVMKAIDA